jgi:hypothetical protein
MVAYMVELGLEMLQGSHFIQKWGFAYHGAYGL